MRLQLACPIVSLSSQLLYASQTGTFIIISCSTENLLFVKSHSNGTLIKLLLSKWPPNILKLIKYEGWFWTLQRVRWVVDEIKNVMVFLPFGSFGRDSATFGPYLIKEVSMNFPNQYSLNRLFIDFCICQCIFRI